MCRERNVQKKNLNYDSLQNPGLVVFPKEQAPPVRGIVRHFPKRFPAPIVTSMLRKLPFSVSSLPGFGNVLSAGFFLVPEFLGFFVIETALTHDHIDQGSLDTFTHPL